MGEVRKTLRLKRVQIGVYLHNFAVYILQGILQKDNLLYNIKFGQFSLDCEQGSQM